MKPTYAELVAELQLALDAISYLGPEEFDDEAHKEAYHQNLERLQSMINSARKE